MFRVHGTLDTAGCDLIGRQLGRLQRPEDPGILTWPASHETHEVMNAWAVEHMVAGLRTAAQS